MKNNAQTTARVFLLEYEDADGVRRLYKDALPARSVFAAARQMAVDGLRPKVIRCIITAAEARTLPCRVRAFR